MTKMRVHELAKELGVENKELLETLRKKDIDVKSHMSSLEEDVISMLRTAYPSGKTTEKSSDQPVEKPTEKPVNKENTETEKKPEGPKKKNIVQVFRPQNLKK